MKSFAKILLAASIVAASASSFAKSTFTLSSPDIAPNQAFAQKHMLNMMGCTGDNISPAFNWSGAPKGTKSLLLTMYDKDADTGSGWWHWVVYNIPASATGFAQGSIPAGAVEARGDGGAPHYGGPCPPMGQKHRYVFTLHALSVDALPVPPDASPAMIGMMATMNRLDKTSFTVKVGR